MTSRQKLITVSGRAKIGVTAHSRCMSDVCALEAYSDNKFSEGAYHLYLQAVQVCSHSG